MQAKQGIIRPQKVVIKPCNTKAKVGSKLVINHNKVDYNFDKIDPQNFPNNVCIEKGRAFSLYILWLVFNDWHRNKY